jgi:hypothetical protein
MALKRHDPMIVNIPIHRFYYRTSQARYLLLNWIARRIDQPILRNMFPRMSPYMHEYF